MGAAGGRVMAGGVFCAGGGMGIVRGPAGFLSSEEPKFAKGSFFGAGVGCCASAAAAKSASVERVLRSMPGS